MTEEELQELERQLADYTREEIDWGLIEKAAMEIRRLRQALVEIGERSYPSYSGGCCIDWDHYTQLIRELGLAERVGLP